MENAGELFIIGLIPTAIAIGFLTTAAFGWLALGCGLMFVALICLFVEVLSL